MAIKGQLSGEQVEAVFARGGSIIYNGQIITSMGQMPSAVDLATEDDASSVQADIDARIATLQDQRKKLDILVKESASTAPVQGGGAPPPVETKK